MLYSPSIYMFSVLTLPPRESRLAGKLEAGLSEEDIPDFLYIEENDFSKYERSSNLPAASSSKGKLAEEVFPCDCRWPGDWNIEGVSPAKLASVACGEAANCINRTLFIECRPRDCPCGERCQNQRFQRAQYKDIEIMKAPGKGHGLRTRVDLQPGDFVIEYVGEVVSPGQMHKRVEMNQKLGQKHYYFMTLQHDQILDATRKGNLARFMNHSCRPNCATQKWIVDGRVRIGLFALQAVPAGSELTFDYKFVRFSSASEAQACLCGEPNCKGVIGTERRGGEEESSDGSAESDGPDDHDHDDDDDDDGADAQGGVEDAEDVPAIAKALLRKEKAADLMPLIQTLAATRSPACLKRFVALHGLQILQIILGQHAGNLRIVGAAVEVLRILPVPSRTVLEEAGIVGRLEGWLEAAARTGSGEEEDPAGGALPALRARVADLLAGWAALEHAFRIPRAPAAAAAGAEESGAALAASAPASVASGTPLSDIFPSSASASSSALDGVAAGYRVELGDARFKVSKWSSVERSGRARDGREQSPPPGEERAWRRDQRDQQRPSSSASASASASASSASASSYRQQQAQQRDTRTSPPNRRPDSYARRQDYDSAAKRARPSPSPAAPVAASSANAPSAPSLPEGWREARAADGKPYYYNELTRETRWDPPPAPVPMKKPVSEIQVEGLGDEGIARIISRAKAAVLARAEGENRLQQQSQERRRSPSPVAALGREPLGRPPQPSNTQSSQSGQAQSQTLGKIREEISAFVVKFLSRYKAQFAGPDAFKEMARKLAHGLADKEHRSMALLGGAPFEMTRQKRLKMAAYLAQYLQSHGFKDVDAGNHSSSS